MNIGKVVGSVVSTQKDERLDGHKLMVVQIITPVRGSCELRPVEGSFTVAVDLVGAGAGELVLLTSGSSARNATGNLNAPIDVAISGIIDSVNVEASEVL